MSDDFSGVKAAYDKSGYNAGDVITVKISGQDVLTTTATGKVGPLTVPLVAANGVKSTLTVAAMPVTLTTVLPESVVIDASVAIVDTSATPRTWTLSADKLSITATA